MPAPADAAPNRLLKGFLAYVGAEIVRHLTTPEIHIYPGVSGPISVFRHIGMTLQDFSAAC
ncbi:hypothetical protein CDV49_05470 [Haematobacter genomosp. 1]|uniref:Uncharacterized protein n=1 Tax=Haematobacter genomosp. 1 TaxID=366618 RepID=A0A212ADL9_9RHOB|nr:hypothetical protein CDV49_05470 [Haematobacter genomosp. 1]